MTRVESVREEVQRLMHHAPFEPFALILENGDRVVIEHPENLAFDPDSKPGQRRAGEFYVLSRQLRLFSNFEAATSVVLVDHGN